MHTSHFFEPQVILRMAKMDVLKLGSSSTLGGVNWEMQCKLPVIVGR